MKDSLSVDKSEACSVAPPLWTKGFVALLITQFMVALNDNIFRWLIIPIGKCAIGWSDKADQIRTIGSLAFVVPFMLLASWAGYACDKFNRRSVLIWCKVAELVIMIIGTAAILSRSVPFMLVTLFLMASQSAFFSPAKYGSIPNLVVDKRISEANGYLAMTTMIACIAGTGIGGVLFALTTLNHTAPAEGSGGMTHWWIWASVIIGVAVVGLISSFFIPSIEAADPKAKFPVNPFTQITKDLKFLFNRRFLFWIAIASSYFWGFAALVQVNIDKYATEYLHVSQEYVSVLLVSLSIGLALGSLLAGRLSRGKIELRLVPYATLFIIIFCAILYFTPSVSTNSRDFDAASNGVEVAELNSTELVQSESTELNVMDASSQKDELLVQKTAKQTESAVSAETEAESTNASPVRSSVAPPTTVGFIFGAIGLFLLGISAGLFDVPLLATLQTKSPEEARCRILAAYNFCSFAAMALCSLLQGMLASQFHLSSHEIWLFCGAMSLPVLYFTGKSFLFSSNNPRNGETQVD